MSAERPSGGTFAPRAIPLRQAGALLAEAARILAVAPGRILGCYLLVYLPVQLIAGEAYLAMPLQAVVASIGFTGMFGVLEAARHGRVPGMRELFEVGNLPRDKLLLLALAGLVPVAMVWLAWCLDLGTEACDRLLAAPLAAVSPENSPEGAPVIVGAANPPWPLRLEAAVIENGFDALLLFIQPLCLLFPWSATRTLAANLLASLVNWRWGLLLAASLGSLNFFVSQANFSGLAETLLLLALDVLLGSYVSALVLALLRRSLAA